MDPAGRRANVLVSGGQGPRFVGQIIRLGPARIEIKGITEPCPVMEQAAKGLRDAVARLLRPLARRFGRRLGRGKA